MNSRLVSFQELKECGRLDPSHFLPIHRTWEHFTTKNYPKRQAIVNDWLKGKVSNEELQKAIKTGKRAYEK